MLTALNIGLAVCCGGLLVWNLRLSRQNRALAWELWYERARRSIFGLSTGAQTFTVDADGTVVDPPRVVT